MPFEVYTYILLGVAILAAFALVGLVIRFLVIRARIASDDSTDVSDTTELLDSSDADFDTAKLPRIDGEVEFSIEYEITVVHTDEVIE